MKYNKLVRDNIIKHIESKGEVATYHIATDVEYWEKLKEKLQEEVQEFFADESLGELADIKEVLDAILEYKGYTKESLDIEQREKANKRGKFKKHIILDES